MVPRIGPSIVPSAADDHRERHLGGPLHAEDAAGRPRDAPGAGRWRATPPAAPQPAAATTKTSSRASPTRAPELRAARLVVADRGQHEAEPAAQQEVHRGHGEHRDRERRPVGVGGQQRRVAARAAGQRHAGAAADGLEPLDEQHDRRRPAPRWRSRSTRCAAGRPATTAAARRRPPPIAAIGNAGERRDPVHRGDQHEVRAEPEERLLADRDQPRVAGQQVPHAGQRQHDEPLHHDRRWCRSTRSKGTREHHDDDERADAGPARRSAATGLLGNFPPERRRGVSSISAHDSDLRAVSPCGRITRTARKTT